MDAEIVKAEHYMRKHLPGHFLLAKSLNMWETVSTISKDGSKLLQGIPR